jgi:hypothetical protein
MKHAAGWFERSARVLATTCNDDSDTTESDTTATRHVPTP